MAELIGQQVTAMARTVSGMDDMTFACKPHKKRAVQHVNGN